MIFVTGDIHCPIDIKKINNKNFSNKYHLTANDYLIVCGDMGICWEYPWLKEYKTDLHWQKWLAEKPFTTLFVDGNHENFSVIKTLKVVDKFGSKAHKVNDKIFHLIRGNIYNIENKDFFCFGGAESVDKLTRVPLKTWWEEELPNTKEIHHALYNLYKNKNKVDYIITHCSSKRIQKEICGYYNNNILTGFFDVLEDSVDFKKWFFGHYHDDIKLDSKHELLYNNIVMIE